MKQRSVRIFFVFYILFVIKVFIFKYPIQKLQAIAASWKKDVILEGLSTANFTPFKTIKMYIEYSYKLNSAENLLGNIVVLIPFGMLFPLITRKNWGYLGMLVCAFAFVLGIEVFQLFSAFGAFDVDDILLNCLGASLGYLFYRIVSGRGQAKEET